MSDSNAPFAENIISAENALALAASGKPIVFLDARFSPSEQDLEGEYDAEHIAGAHYVNLATQLQGKGGGLAGARPLPEAADLQKNIALWGIHPDTTVIVYARGTPAAAARAWFVLKWAGLPDVRYLDGGLAAWKAVGGKTDATRPAAGGGTFVITEVERLPTVTADDIAGYIEAGRKVFDARGAAGFAGDGSERSGHIPGAESLPATRFLDADGRFASPEAIRATIEARGARSDDRIGVYCGGGVAGALETLALRSAGIDARLFVGSFSAWAADPRRSVAQGND